jgi:photosystem II stability/assembly factor-like uncharacterized protein
MPGHERHSGLARPRRGLVAIVVALALPAVAHAVAVRDHLYAVKALSDAEAWAVGNFGSIYQTRDGGRTWAPRESGTKAPLFGVDFADARHGWAVGKSALVVHTADGGRTWKKQRSAIPAEKHLFNVQAVDARTAWAVGDWGAITVTRDGGAVWEDRSLDQDVVLYDVSFPDPEHGFIVGEFGTVLATRDGGRTWTPQQVGTEKTLFGVAFASPTRGWAVGIDGLILHTRDGGAVWEVQRGEVASERLEDLGFLESIKNPGLYDVHVVGRYGVVVGDTGVLLTSVDGGETWTRRELPEAQRLVWMRGVSLLPGTRGFVVGANGFAAAVERDRVVLPNGGPAATAETR